MHTSSSSRSKMLSNTVRSNNRIKKAPVAAKQMMTTMGTMAKKSAAAGAPGTAYQVLYSKRSGGKKKTSSGGASKSRNQQDGILNILPPPSSMVTLTESNDSTSTEEEDDDDDDTATSDEESGSSSSSGASSDEERPKKKKKFVKRKKYKWKKSKKHKKQKTPPKMKQQNYTKNKKKKNQVLFSKVEKEISMRYCQQQQQQQQQHDGDIIYIGSYEIEIISFFSPSTTPTTQKSNQLQQQSKLIQKSIPHSNTRTITRRPLLMKKKVMPMLSRLGKSTGTCVPVAVDTIALACASSGSSSIKATQMLKKTNTKIRTTKLPPPRKLLSPTTTYRRPLLATGHKRKIHTITRRTSDTGIMNQRNIGSRNSTNSNTTTIKTATSTKSEHAAKNLTDTTDTTHPRSDAAARAVDAATASFSSARLLSEMSIPVSIQNVLKPHQVDGINFVWKALTGTNKGAILADEMGLGKTLMTIAVICALHRRCREKHFVLVCPSSLVSNWSHEFDKWIGKACQPKRIVITKGGEENCHRKVTALKHHPLGHVWILSYELFRRNGTHAFASMDKKQFALLAVDEGHRLKNTAGNSTIAALKALPCAARLCITATPIQNNLTEFYSLANFVCPGILGDMSYFKKEYERPISIGNSKNALFQEQQIAKYQARALDNITKSFMIRRLQMDVLKSMLPPRMEFLLFCRPTQLQCEYYRKVVASSSVVASVASTKAEVPRASMPIKTQDALTMLINLRKLCSHPRLLHEKKKETIRDYFHWSEQDIALSGKLAVLDSLLVSIRKKAPSDKVVIVSNFTSVLSMIESTIFNTAARGWSFLRLDGSTVLKNRQARVDMFNRTDAERSFAFLLSSKAGGCGINLIGANRLIMFDPDWNPAVDIQAMARIYRPGQTKKSFIYRLFTTGTVEEVICQRQMQKGNLAELVVIGAGSSSSSKMFSKEELADCFTLKEDCDCDTKKKLGTSWPSYEGPQSLYFGDDRTDQSLIATVEAQKQTVSFVYMVDEKDRSTLDSTATDNAILGESHATSQDTKSEEEEEDDDDDENAYSSDSEYEF